MKSVGVQGYEAVGVGERQGAEKDAVDYGEKSAVGADAQRESQNGDDREIGRLGERADSVADVLQQGLHAISRIRMADHSPKARLANCMIGMQLGEHTVRYGCQIVRLREWASRKRTSA